MHNRFGKREFHVGVFNWHPGGVNAHGHRFSLEEDLLRPVEFQFKPGRSKQTHLGERRSPFQVARGRAQKLQANHRAGGLFTRSVNRPDANALPSPVRT